MSSDDGIIYIEQTLLGAIIQNGANWDEINGKISEECFSLIQHQIMFREMKAMSMLNKPIDVATLTRHIQNKFLEDNIGGQEYIQQLYKQSYGKGNLAYYASLIHNYHTKKKLIETLEEALQNARSNKDTSVAELLASTEQKLLSIATTNTMRGSGPRHFHEMVSEYLDKITNGTDIFIPTGFAHVDELLDGGMRGGELIIIGARPGQGKTTLALNIVKNVIVENKKELLVFNLEMSNMQFVDKIMSSTASVDSSVLKRRIPDDTFANALVIMNQTLGLTNFRIDSTEGLTIAELCSRARREKRIHNTQMIVVDYLGLIEGETKYNSKVYEIANITRSLKCLAKELNIPVVLLCQINRASVSGSEVRKPMMSDLRDSGAIEQDADIIMLIHREDYYNPQSIRQGITDLIVCKNRTGNVGEVELMFHGKLNKFVDHRGSNYVRV